MRILIFFAFLLSVQPIFSQNVLGFWKNIDDEDGKAKSVIEIYESDGHIYGRVDRLLEAATLTHCEKCKGDKKDAPITDMVILWDLHGKKGNKKAEKGKIIDPKSGKVYDCKIELEGSDVLKVRGYIGASLFGRTQKWYRQQ